MKVFSRVAAIIAASCIIVGPAAADDGDTYGYVLGSYLDSDGNVTIDDGFGIELGAGREISRWWNIEGYLQNTDTDGSPGLVTFGVGSNLQLVFNRENSFQPYVFGSLGYHRVKLTNLDSDRTLIRAAGIGFRSFFGDSQVALRGEYRYRDYDAHSTDVDDELFSLGVQFPFGKKAAAPIIPATIPDTDGDGVDDNEDRCPRTPAGVSVDATGCALDRDGDGVADHIDQCPGTVRGADVDEKGCELDSDNDGVVNRLDQCPNSAAGVQVDIQGCEIKEVIQLPGVNFESNSDRLLSGVESVLNNAAATLKKNPEIKVEVAGHTDSDGAADYNESLSTRRAETVRDYLIGEGVDANRMTARGYGESEPVADNATSAGKATNRRVELRITER